MLKTCPKCNQPTRIGAKYCGFCATPLNAGPPPETQPQVNSNKACPHCNAPLRPGIKYCANCGKLVATAHASSPALLLATPDYQPPLETKNRPRHRFSRLAVSLITMLIIFLVIAIPVAIFGQPLIKQLFVAAPPTQTPTQIAISIPTNTTTPSPSATPLPSSTPTMQPTPTLTRPPSVTPTRLMPPTSTPSLIPVLLSDDFNQPLDSTWETWGEPNLTPVNTSNIQGLLINASNIDSGGISSLNTEIALTPGISISFTADVDYLDDRSAVLRFAWSPGTATLPEVADSLPVVLLIDSRQLTVEITTKDGILVPCHYPVEDAAHTYLLEINNNMLPAISVDGIPICQDTLPPLTPSNLPGARIHISGRGLIDRIYVSFIP